MHNEIFELIKQYNSIIIGRHKSPDYDAYGSQFGMYYALRDAFPQKLIYVIGDTNSINYFEEMDSVPEKISKKSLFIILDTVASQMLEPETYANYDKLILIDHHRNAPDIKYDLYYQDVNASSCSEMVTELLLDWKININKKAARALYIGILGDTGRFLYNSTTPKALKMASVLLDKGIDIQEIHNLLYLESRFNKYIKSIFFRSVKYTKCNVAYRKNTLNFLNKHNLTTNYVSRGMVNQMAGLKDVPIWVNFTFDKKSKKILCEFRSRKYPVVNVAKKYGGGGHLFASGCSLSSWKETKNVLEDLDKLLEENDGTKEI